MRDELRAVIRELLVEELAAVRAELSGAPQVERAAVGSEADLTDFALKIARRAQDEPGFVAALEAGRIRFAPLGAPAGQPPHPAAIALPVAAATAPALATGSVPLVASMPPSVPELRKGLITERDVAAIARGETRLRIAKSARMTPLATDEARRRGIRIERTLA